MLVMRAYRHKLVFTPVQAAQAAHFAGCARLIYNSGLQQRMMGYEIYKRGLSYAGQCSHLPAAKQAEGFEFLQDTPSHILQQSLRDLDVAFQRFFQGQAAYPKFKKRGQNDSFRFPDPKQIGAHHAERQGQVRLPKLGWVKVKNCYPRLGVKLFEGALKHITVMRENDGWYASFTCQTEIADAARPAGEPIGLDPWGS
jgi:putative transposase